MHENLLQAELTFLPTKTKKRIYHRRIKHKSNHQEVQELLKKYGLDKIPKVKAELKRPVLKKKKMNNSASSTKEQEEQNSFDPEKMKVEFCRKLYGKFLRKVNIGKM